MDKKKKIIYLFIYLFIVLFMRDKPIIGKGTLTPSLNQ